MPPNDIEQAISIKEAYENAVDFARPILGDLQFSLEEIDRGEYKGTPVWELTLGYPVAAEPDSLGALGSLAQEYSSLFRKPKVYKRFFVDLQTGKVISMKLRESNGS